MSLGHSDRVTSAASRAPGGTRPRGGLHRALHAQGLGHGQRGLETEGGTGRGGCLPPPQQGLSVSLALWFQCWETQVGQEMYKLMIFDFIMILAVTIFVDFPRK